jgi:hypothetical protein
VIHCPRTQALGGRKCPCSTVRVNYSAASPFIRSSARLAKQACFCCSAMFQARGRPQAPPRLWLAVDAGAWPRARYGLAHAAGPRPPPEHCFTSGFPPAELLICFPSLYLSASSIVPAPRPSELGHRGNTPQHLLVLPYAPPDCTQLTPSQAL